MASSTPISPFATPEVAPPPVVVLLDSTELHIKPPPSLLAFEDLPPASFNTMPACPTTARVRFHPYSCKETSVVSSSGRQPTSQSTPPHATPPLSEQPPVLSSLADSAAAYLANTSPLSSPASSPRSSPAPRPDRSQHTFLGVVSTKIKIERPKGAARKNLRDQVKWDQAFLTSVKVFHPL